MSSIGYLNECIETINTEEIIFMLETQDGRDMKGKFKRMIKVIIDQLLKFIRYVKNLSVKTINMLKKKTGIKSNSAHPLKNSSKAISVHIPRYLLNPKYDIHILIDEISRIVHEFEKVARSGMQYTEPFNPGGLLYLRHKDSYMSDLLKRTIYMDGSFTQKDLFDHIYGNITPTTVNVSERGTILDNAKTIVNDVSIDCQTLLKDLIKYLGVCMDHVFKIEEASDHEIYSKMLVSMSGINVVLIKILGTTYQVMDSYASHIYLLHSELEANID